MMCFILPATTLSVFVCFVLGRLNREAFLSHSAWREIKGVRNISGGSFSFGYFQKWKLFFFFGELLRAIFTSICILGFLTILGV